MVSKPKAPDPYETAQAQGQMNQNTAVTQQLLNMVDQQGPQGSISYTQNGTTTVMGADGKPITVPKFTQTTTLTPTGQATYDAGANAQLALAQTAENQMGSIRDMLSNPFEYTNRDAENWAYDLASPRILQQQAQNETTMRNQLVNAGIRPGTQAWESEMRRLSNANTDQLNQLALTGRQQGFNEAMATRNQPINEIMALLTGSQVSNPSYGATPQTQVGGVDYMGAVNNAYNAQMQSYGGIMGGLFGSLGSVGSAFAAGGK